jgi:hypothetical protein
VTARPPAGVAARSIRRPTGRPAARRGGFNPKPLSEISVWPQLVVIAPSPAEVVLSMGGWLFDQAMAGWDAVLLSEDNTNVRAVAILGARVYRLEERLAEPFRMSQLQTIAVRGELYDRDPRVRQVVLDALRGRSAEVTFWGDAPPAEFEGTAQLMRHQLSIAARAFKAHALAALPTRFYAAASRAADLGHDFEVFSRVPAVRS